MGKKMLAVLSGIVLIALVATLAIGGSKKSEGTDNSAPTTTGASTTTTTTVVSTESTIPDSCSVAGNVDPACHPEAEEAPYEEVGPGKCFPGDQILERLRTDENAAHDFVAPWSAEELELLKGEQLAWMDANQDSPCLRGLALFLNQYMDYYEVNRVLLERWNRLNPDDQRTEWVFDLSVVQLADYYRENVLAPVPAGGVAVSNHYYDHDDPTKVVYWKDQVLPENELVWWLKGHSPGDGKGPVVDLKPITKFMCGNPLLPPGTPPPPPPPPPDTTVPPPPPPPPKDVCPNIDGNQGDVPDGLIVDENGNCVPPPPPPTDVCPLVPGNQSSVPEGYNEDCLTPKDPTVDVNVNPEVPDQVQGPGTTPIGVDPGPATEPVDSPTGCTGSCNDEVEAPAAEQQPAEGTGSQQGSAGTGTSEDGTELPAGGNAGVTDPEDAVEDIDEEPVNSGGDTGGF